jgi:hypothetical protein
MLNYPAKNVLYFTDTNPKTLQKKARQLSQLRRSRPGFTAQQASCPAPRASQPYAHVAIRQAGT